MAKGKSELKGILFFRNPKVTPPLSAVPIIPGDNQRLRHADVVKRPWNSFTSNTLIFDFRAGEAGEGYTLNDE